MRPPEAIKPGAGRFRQYSPMTLALAVAVLLAVAILPSALNIPQANPNTVPEYAPVPPDEESQTSESGNLAALGQAGGSSLSRSGGLPEAIPTAAAQRRSGKRCVGDPPRQTEDPMSPPCVAFFEGDNGGATYPGVTGEEIVVLIYWDAAGSQNAGDGVEGTPPAGSYCDIDLPPDTGGPSCWAQRSQRDHAMVRWARAFSNYFNARYQTYKRHVHFWGYFGSANTAEAKRSVASEHYLKLKPFAALDQTIFSGNDDAYLDAMARRRVMIFTGNNLASDYKPAAFFGEYAPQVWQYIPDIEHWAEHYISYVCRKVAGYPVAHTVGTFSDGRPMLDSPRKYAFVSTGDPFYTGYPHFASLVKSGVRSRCQVDGMEIYYLFEPQSATNNIARMKTENVTTALFLGGFDFYMTHAGDSAKYYPEVLYAGNGNLETNVNTRQNQNSNWARNAWVISDGIRADSLDQDPRYASCKEGDPSLSKGSCGFGTQFQRDYFMLFGAIQAAGPRLTPKAVDRGFHAIPAIRSSSPSVASCFFDPGDYTCVKDAQQSWWDPNGRPSSNQPGCWKMVDEGRRYLANQWEPGDNVFPNSTDICNSYGDGRGGVFEPQP